MFCTNCGAKVPDGSVFCPSCGTKLQADASAINPAVNAAAEDARQQAEPFQQGSRQAADPPIPGNPPEPNPYPQGQPYQPRPARRPEDIVSLKILCGILGGIGAIGFLTSLVGLFTTNSSLAQLTRLDSIFGASTGIGGIMAVYTIFSLLSLIVSGLLVFVEFVVVFRWTPERNDGFFVAITALEVIGLVISIIFVIIFTSMVSSIIGGFSGTVIAAIFALLLVPGLYFLLSYLAGLTPLKTKGGFSAFFPELKKAPAMIIGCLKQPKA